MIWIYRRAASEGATLLAEDICLQGERARRSQGRLLQERIEAGDKVICWGDPLPQPLRTPLNTLKVLNNVAPLSKFEEAQKLAAVGVATVQVTRTRPAARPAGPYQYQPYNDAIGRVNNLNDANGIITRLQQYIQQEQQREREHRNRPVEEWLARRNNHVGGSDLLNPPAQPDYYSKKENIVEEYRLHMFRGKSIRAGKKVQRQTRPDGRTPAHQWIRSFDAGWIIAYENFRSTEAQRKLAAAAIKALGLDFGAVDLGKTADGRLIVLEVNRAPGVEGGTAQTYATKIIEWSRE